MRFFLILIPLFLVSCANEKDIELLCIKDAGQKEVTPDTMLFYLADHPETVYVKIKDAIAFGDPNAEKPEARFLPIFEETDNYYKAWLDDPKSRSMEISRKTLKMSLTDYGETRTYSCTKWKMPTNQI